MSATPLVPGPAPVRTALVIGGGIAGPVVAAALRQAGVGATVFEAHPALSDGIGGSLALAPNGVAALEIIGAAEAVRAIATPIGRSLLAVGGASQELPAATGLEPLQMVGRGDLHRVLHDRAAELGVRFAYGKRLVAVEEAPGSVTGRFADGSTATGDILIGADGIRSVVRTLIDPDAPSAGYTGLLGLQGYVEAGDGLDPEPGVMTFAFGERAYYLYWKQADGRVTWGANLPSKEYLSFADARAISTETWLETLRTTYAGDSPGELLADRTRADQLDVTGAIHIMAPVPHWHRGRMVLVGDAVHAPSNSTGQGASLAIESAIQLARCVRDLADPEAAFAAYEGLRRRRVETITKRGARTNSAKTPGPVGRKLMHLLMPLFFRIANLAKTLEREQGYRIDWDARVDTDGAPGAVVQAVGS